MERRFGGLYSASSLPGSDVGDGEGAGSTSTAGGRLLVLAWKALFLQSSGGHVTGRCMLTMIVHPSAIVGHYNEISPNDMLKLLSVTGAVCFAVLFVRAP